MNTYIALLRGINVGGHHMVKMVDLKKMVEKLSFHNVRTYIQSGNIIFESTRTLKEGLVQQEISTAIKSSVGFDVPVTVLSLKTFKRIVENNPYAKKDAHQDSLHVTFFNASQNGLDAIDPQGYLPDVFVATPVAAYLQLTNPYHKTKLSNSFFERITGVQATTRNWKTVCKLLELASIELP